MQEGCRGVGDHIKWRVMEFCHSSTGLILIVHISWQRLGYGALFAERPSEDMDPLYNNELCRHGNIYVIIKMSSVHSSRSLLDWVSRVRSTEYRYLIWNVTSWCYVETKISGYGGLLPLLMMVEQVGTIIASGLNLLQAFVSTIRKGLCRFYLLIFDVINCWSEGFLLCFDFWDLDLGMKIIKNCQHIISLPHQILHSSIKNPRSSKLVVLNPSPSQLLISHP